MASGRLSWKVCATCALIAVYALIIGPAGSTNVFSCSAGLKNADWPWTSDALDKWLEDQRSVFSDTHMACRQAGPEVRRKIIAFLQTKVD